MAGYPIQIGTTMAPDSPASTAAPQGASYQGNVTPFDVPSVINAITGAF